MSPDGAAVLVASSGDGILEAPLTAPQIFLHSVEGTTWTPISRSVDGQLATRPASDAVASSDGSRIAFASEADNLVPGDTNDASDIFVVVKSGAIRRIVPSSH
jgi:Tol biopolymer transport system component